MTEKEAVQEAVQDQIITFKGKQYYVKDLSKEAVRCVDHIVDLEKKIYVSGLELEQYQHSYAYFNDMLGTLLEPEV